MSSARRISVVTGTRADYGILRALLDEIERHPALDLELLVTGMHLSPEFGLTVRQIEADGYPIGDRIEILLSSDTEVGIATSVGLGVMGFASRYQRRRPDILVLLGDRFESLAAAIAAMLARVPIAHISGGKTTQGAIDEAIRHVLTKMSHVHFTHTPEHKARIVQMGEEPDRVHVFGALLIDELTRLRLVPRTEVASILGVDLDDGYLLIVFHPVTLEENSGARQMAELLLALETVGRQAVFILPNADAGGRAIMDRIEAYVAAHPGRALRFVSLERPVYLQLLANAHAIVGNSSSGITEAPSVGVPAVNIGDRQRGILKAANVVDCAPHKEAIVAAIAQATDSDFRRRVAGDRRNPFGEGDAARRITHVLATLALDEVLLKKRFHDGRIVSARGLIEVPL